MSELALIPGIERFEGQQTVVEPETKWHIMLDHETTNGDRFTVMVDTLHSYDPSAYRVNFVEHGGERALGMLVQKAGEFYDFNQRWHREIVFDRASDHCITGDVQRQEYFYHHDGAMEPLFPRKTTPNT